MFDMATDAQILLLIMALLMLLMNVMNAPTTEALLARRTERSSDDEYDLETQLDVGGDVGADAHTSAVIARSWASYLRRADEY